MKNVSRTLLFFFISACFKAQAGVSVELNKEAARVIREMKFSVPDTLNGENNSFCTVFSISFKTQ